jgi:hypothetical protein
MLKVKKICILLRVYNRIEDLSINIKIIKETWCCFDYEIIVISNGQNEGYIIPDSIKSDIYKCIELQENYGHLKGSSQLLIEGCSNINWDKYSNIIILEADTWIYGDDLIKKYIEKMNENNAVWASARWYQRFYSLATDFAIINTKFLKDNIKIFDFENFPECHIANYLQLIEKKFLLINECMPVLVPSYLKHFPFASLGRIYIFPKAKMVTHHMESFKGDMEKKKMDFNTISDMNYFDLKGNHIFIRKQLILLALLLYKLLPQRTWYSKRVHFRNF